MPHLTWTITSSARKLSSPRAVTFNRITLEAEIRSLYSLKPESLKQLSTLFANAVVEACTSLTGVSTGEALLRRIGDEKLRSPVETYEQIDTLLHGGSETLKAAIEQRFRIKVHRLYKMSMNLEARSLSAS